MKIYFAGSIRGGRDDQEDYFKIIEHLKKHGEVLTEHVGMKSINSTGEEGLSDEEIFDRDVKWIEEAEVLIAEVSNPSLGVGYEIGIAEKLNKKILCLFREENNKKLSAMVGGNNNIAVSYYKNTENSFNIIDDFLSSIKNSNI